jgi:hypothetical protein
MKNTDDHRRASLPVTAEVGDEGGSFADPTAQVATFDGELGRCGSEGHGGTAWRLVRSESMSANEDEDVKKGLVKYPNEE